MDLEERLRRLERMLVDVLARLESIEERLGELGGGETAEMAFRLVTAFSLPAAVALEAARRVVSTARSLGGVDPLSRAVLEALSDCEPLTVSEVTRRVRRIKGSASRRTVRERLALLERRGAVVNVGSGSRPRYLLRSCRGSGVEP